MTENFSPFIVQKFQFHAKGLFFFISVSIIMPWSFENKLKRTGCSNYLEGIVYFALSGNCDDNRLFKYFSINCFQSEKYRN